MFVPISAKVDDGRVIIDFDGHRGIICVEHGDDIYKVCEETVLDIIDGLMFCDMVIPLNNKNDYHQMYKIYLPLTVYFAIIIHNINILIGK